MAAVLALAGVALSAGRSVSISSPNGRLLLRVSLNGAGRLGYCVLFDRKKVIDDSPLGLVREDDDFSRDLVFESVDPQERVDDPYRLLCGSRRNISVSYNQRSLHLLNGNRSRMILDMRCGNSGVAFRYRFPGESKTLLKVVRELTGFRFPKDARGWMAPYRKASAYAPAYEEYYEQVVPGDPPPAVRGKPRGWAFPALFQAGRAGAWILLSESGTTGSYCGCHLSPNAPGGLYTVRFPYSDENTKDAIHRDSTAPLGKLPWTMPWRVVVVADDACGIAESTWITDLAPPCRVKDISWIRPGRASWSWWAFPEKTGFETYRDYIDLARSFSWEYSLMDAGWWKENPDRLMKYASENGVKCLFWTHASQFYNDRKRRKKLDRFVEMGAAGVKVDFWCSDRQETMAAIEKTLADAAERKLLVNLHGCPLPRGWHRTWPNLVAAEAVLGSESYMFEKRYSKRAAQLNTVLPFTRGVMGPMDYTPMALSAKRYPRKTTAVHELALLYVFNCGIIHFADRPEVYEALPPSVQKLLRTVPVLWDESDFVSGTPGEFVVVTRRKGETVFFAGINGSNESRLVKLDLRKFGRFPSRTLYADNPGAAEPFRVRAVPLSDSLEVSMQPRGGFVFKLSKISSP